MIRRLLRILAARVALTEICDEFGHNFYIASVGPAHYWTEPGTGSGNARLRLNGCALRCACCGYEEVEDDLLAYGYFMPNNGGVYRTRRFDVIFNPLTKNEIR